MGPRFNYELRKDKICPICRDEFYTYHPEQIHCSRLCAAKTKTLKVSDPSRSSEIKEKQTL